MYNYLRGARIHLYLHLIFIAKVLDLQGNAPVKELYLIIRKPSNQYENIGNFENNVTGISKVKIFIV